MSVICAVVALVASSSAPVVVDVTPGAERFISPEAVRQALVDDLHIPIEPNSGSLEELRGTLTIAVDARRHLVLVYRDAAGREIHRSVTAPHSPAAAVHLVVLVAGNLIRNEAEEILAALEPAKPPASPEPGTTIARPQPSPEPNQLLTTATTPPSALGNRSEAHRLAVGLLGYLSPRSAEVTASGSGLFLSYAVTRYLAVGVTDLLFAPVGGRYALSGGPMLEAFWFAREWLQLFSQFGLPMQALFGGRRDAGFALQPFLSVGPRLWIGSHVSLGAGVRLAFVATKVFASPPAELTQGTVSLSGGLELALHL